MFGFMPIPAGGSKIGYIDGIVTPSSTGVVEYTDERLGGQTPTGAYIMSSIANNGTEPDMNFSVGITDGTTVVSMRASAEDNKGTCNTRREMNTSTIVRLQSPAFAAICYATFVEFTPNGIKLNYFNVSGGGGQSIAIMLFAGVNCHVGIEAIPTTQGNTLDVTDPGFQPTGIIGLYQAYTAIPAALNGYSWAVGFCDQDRRRGIIASVAPDNLSTTDCRQQRRNSRIAMSTQSYDSKAANIDSINSDGFTIEAEGNSNPGYDMAYLCFDGIDTYVDARTLNVSASDMLTLGSASFTPNAALMIGGTTVSLNVEDTDSDADYMWLTTFFKGEYNNLRLKNEDNQATSDADVRSTFTRIIDGTGPALELDYDSMASGGIRVECLSGGTGALITMNMKG